MKQILLFLLLLLPCFAMAQYTANANQKITLGEQTTADGLVYRGVLNDTALITPLSDTSAYIILDTVNNKFYNYNRLTNVWSVAGGGTAVTSVATGLGLSGGTITSTGTILVDTASASIISRQRATNTFLTPTGSAANLTSFPTLNQNTTGSAATLTTGRTVQTNLASTSAATFNGSANITPGVTGVLPVANGGTNQSTLTANKVMVGNGTSGVLTPTNLHWDNTNSRLGIGILNPTNPLEVLRKNNSWVNFKDTLAGGFFSISNGTGNSNITYPIFNIQGAGNFGANLQYTAAFIAYKDSLATENTGDQVWLFDARKRKSNPLGANINVTKVLNGFTFFFGNYGDPQLVINANDNVGIATSSPTQKLHVNGNARISAMNGINDIGADANGVLQAATSDMNLKNTIENSPFGLNEILLLNPVTFLYNDKNRKIDSDVKEVGFIAQDVFDIIPNAVSSTGTGDLQLDYRAITAALVKAIQEQNALIKALEQRILTLENK